MAKIFAPNKAYNGETASVHFASGVGETDKPVLLDWFREHGYTVEDTSIDPEDEDNSTLEAVEKAEHEAKVLDDAEKEKKAAK